MPSWVINHVTAYGSKDNLEKFADSVRTEELKFDFNTIVPMPESLDVTSGGDEDEAILYFVSDRLVRSVSDLLDDPVLETRYAANRGIHDVVFGGKENWIRQHQENIEKNITDKDRLDSLYENGRIYADNLTRYGCSSWYDWRNLHWGTKWNACEADVSQPTEVFKGYILKIEFQTAWSAPFELFEEMRKKYPDLTFDGEYADEDIGVNCGTWHGGSLLMSVHDMSRTKKGKNLACKLWDIDPSELDEDDDEQEE